MKGSWTSRVAAVLFFIAILSSPYWLYRYFNKKPVQTIKQVSSQVILLTPAGAAVHDAYPTWDNIVCNSVGEKRLRIGMRKEMVEAAWGRPRTIVWRSDARAEGVASEILSTKEEEWIMDDGPNPRRAIFRNFMGHNAPDNTAKLIYFQDSISFRVPR